MSNLWEVYAIKYADRNGRTRRESFLFDDDHAGPHPMDYFVWLLRNGDQHILVDTGYDHAEAKRRDRPILRDPAESLAVAGLSAEQIETVIITHLHYDHAGGLDRYPRAQFHLQAAEMAFATGPCMCDPTLQMPYTADHVCEMVQHLYSGRVIFHEGSAEIAPGVRVHAIGGHARGLMAVQVMTPLGPLCLASDAAHYYENYLLRKPFPIVVDVEDMVAGFDRIQALANGWQRVVPGHDPLVTRLFPKAFNSDIAWRLDVEPINHLDPLAPTSSR